MALSKIPPEILSVIFEKLDTHERCTSARTCVDFATAARDAFDGMNELCIYSKHASGMDDESLRGVLAQSVAGGALTHVTVRGAGPKVTPAAFEPLTGCATLECIDLRGSASLAPSGGWDYRGGSYAALRATLPPQVVKCGQCIGQWKCKKSRSKCIECRRPTCNDCIADEWPHAGPLCRGCCDDQQCECMMCGEVYGFP